MSALPANVFTDAGLDGSCKQSGDEEDRATAKPASQESVLTRGGLPTGDPDSVESQAF